MDEATQMRLRAKQAQFQDRRWEIPQEVRPIRNMFALEAEIFAKVLAQKSWKYDGSITLHYQGELGADGLGVLYLYEVDQYGNLEDIPTVSHFCLVQGREGLVSWHFPFGVNMGAEVYLTKIQIVCNDTRRAVLAL